MQTSKFSFLVFLLSLFLFAACSDEYQEDATVDNGNTTEELEADIEQSYNNFESWVNEKTREADEITEPEWQELKAEYKEERNELDASMDNASDEIKSGYKSLKQEWKEFEAKMDQRFDDKDNR